MNPAQAYHEYLGPAIFRPCSVSTLATANIQPHERVIDVACGTGIVTAQVRAARVVGLDINPGMLEIAAKTPGVEWIVGNGMSTGQPDAAFDVVLCQQGLQFFPDRDAGAREFRRVCAGRAVVTCWQGIEEQAFFADIMRAQAKHLEVSIADVAKPFSFPDADALRAVLLAAGFSRVEVQVHDVATSYPDPPQFVKMCAGAAIAVMPERFANVDLAPFVAAVSADVQDAMKRYIVGDRLQFTMRTNTALAFV